MFNIDAFGQILEETLKTLSIVGYSYCIVKKSDPRNLRRWSKPKRGASGWAVHPANAAATILYNNDPLNGSILTGARQNSSKKMEIQSLTKTITAVAAMKLLKKKNISIDAPVAAFLPGGWELPPARNGLTFRHLLEHRSGLREFSYDPSYPGYYAPLVVGIGETNSEGSYYRTIKYSFVNDSGLVPGDAPVSYMNINFAVFRILIPYIIDRPNLELVRVAAENTPGTSLQLAYELYMGASYVTYVKENVLSFGPLGVALCDIVAPEPQTRYYNADDIVHDPSDSDVLDVLERCGGNGWKMSPAEYCEFLIDLIDGRHGLFWNQMRGDHYIGLTPRAHMGKFGEYFGKTGAGAHSRTAWLWFPPIPALGIPDVIAVIMVNSDRENDSAIENAPITILGDVYEAAVLASLVPAGT